MHFKKSKLTGFIQDTNNIYHLWTNWYTYIHTNKTNFYELNQVEIALIGNNCGLPLFTVYCVSLRFFLTLDGWWSQNKPDLCASVLFFSAIWVTISLKRCRCWHYTAVLFMWALNAFIFFFFLHNLIWICTVAVVWKVSQMFLGFP